MSDANAMLEFSTLKFHVHSHTPRIQKQPGAAKECMGMSRLCDTLLAQAVLVKEFAWDITEHGGYKWYQTQCRADGFRAWAAVIGECDIAYLSCDKYGDFNVKRNFCIRFGESFEMVEIHNTSGDTRCGLRTFAEAAAFAIRLPSILWGLA